MPKEDLTLIVAVIDASGSMEKIKTGVIDGFNEFINAQKELSGEVIFSMIQFDSGWDFNKSIDDHLRYKEIYDLINLKEIKPLDKSNYVPGGGTPLLAAMDTAIDSIGKKLAAIPEADRPSKVVFVVITDGQENTSDKRKYSKAALASKTKHQQDKYNWKFIYLGANQDSFAEAGGIGFMAKATMDYAATYDGTRGAIVMAGNSISSYRSGLTNDVDLAKSKELDDLVNAKVEK